MLTADEKATQWKERRAFDEQWSAEQEILRRIKNSELVGVDRARFERLREYVAAHTAMESDTVDGTLSPFAVARFGAAFHAIQITDIDPLP